jgi:hypothetical protein
MIQMIRASLSRRDEEGREAGQHRPMRRTGLKMGDQATPSQNSSWPNEALFEGIAHF